MAQRKDTRPAGSILQRLPAELQRDSSPEECTSSCCRPDLSTSEREAHDARSQELRRARMAWCAANGYSLLDLIRAEHYTPLSR